MMAEDAFLIEDYFFVNDELILVSPTMEKTLIGPFCITGPSVFKFELAVNPSLKV